MLDYSLRGSPIILRTGIISPRTYFYPPEPAFQLFNAVVKPSSNLSELQRMRLPLPSRYDSYAVRKRRHGLPNLKHVDVCKRRSIRDVEAIFTPHELEAELDHFAPVVVGPSTSAPASAPFSDAPFAPVVQETTRFDPTLYVTPETTACLSIRLTPDVSPPSPHPPRTDLPNLFWGIMPTHTAFSALSRKHVMPLMHKLESLGLDRGSLAMAANFDSRTNILHLTFPSRSAADVRRILGDDTLNDPLFVLTEWADAVIRADRGSLTTLGLPSRSNPVRQPAQVVSRPAISVGRVVSPTLTASTIRRVRRIQAWSHIVGRAVSGSCVSEEKSWTARSIVSSAVTSISRAGPGSNTATSSDEDEEADDDAWETASEWTDVEVL